MRADDLSAGYGKKIVLHDVSFNIEKGDIISLIGPNGGGKSTLLNTLNGMLSPVSGSVFIGKEDIRDISLKDLAKKLSIVTTDRVRPNLMTCFDVVMAGRLPYEGGIFGPDRKDPEKDRTAAERAMELMNITKYREIPYSALSDGQKQRTLIARAICQEPEYLIMDEPTSYLDIRYRMEFISVIKELQREGMTVIMSLHEIDMAIALSTKLILIYEDGRVEIKSPESVRREDSVKELFSLTDEMYESIRGGFTDVPRTSSQENPPGKRERHSSYFLNKECEYYPCHDVKEEEFSCMFCYCPLYHIEECGGEYTYTEKGVKNCRDCTYPHIRSNYPGVIKKLKSGSEDKGHIEDEGSGK